MFNMSKPEQEDEKASPPISTQQRQFSNITDDTTDDNNSNVFHLPPSDRVLAQITTSTTKSAAATAAADSDRTNSSSITTETSISNNDDNNNTTSQNQNNNDDGDGDVTTSHVSFGSVRVHEHRMTLGSNPDVRYGVPVELAWTAEKSEMFDTIDAFEREKHPDVVASSTTQAFNPTPEHTNDGTTELSMMSSEAELPSPPPVMMTTYPHPVHRLNASDREQIAYQHHTRDSIVRVKKEVQMIQEQRHNSTRDKEPMNHIQEIRRQRLEGTLTIESLDALTKETPNENNNKHNKKKTKKSFWFMCCP